MLKSMTGFGRCENATDEYKISVEMKAVNHRYLDLSIKMPKKFNYFEAAIRKEIYPERKGRSFYQLRGLYRRKSLPEV